MCSNSTIFKRIENDALVTHLVGQVAPCYLSSLSGDKAAVLLLDVNRLIATKVENVTNKQTSRTTCVDLWTSTSCSVTP